VGRPVQKRHAGVDWSVIFDSIASEYGYTWEQFINMTYKLLNCCLEAIAKRTHNNTVIQAAMHGIKMDLYKRVKPVSEKLLEQANIETYKLLQQKQVAAKNGKR